MAYDPRRDKRAGRINHTTNDAIGIDGAHDRAIRIDAFDAAPFERSAMALEVPPRDPVLHRDDERIVVDKMNEIINDRFDLVRLHAEDHGIVSPSLGEACGRFQIADGVLCAVRRNEPKSARADGFEVLAANDKGDVHTPERKPRADITADRPGADDADLHLIPLASRLTGATLSPRPGRSLTVLTPAGSAPENRALLVAS